MSAWNAEATHDESCAECAALVSRAIDTATVTGSRSARVEDGAHSANVERARCEWFALCTNDATMTIPHPVLDAVPACDRCAAKAGAL